jgi:formylglycine-generating enzyme required for sulfatase activity
MQTKSIVLFLFLLPTVSGYSQKSSRNKKLPPGTVQVNDTLFADKTEVANIHWREYLYSILSTKTESEYLEALQDTSVWNADTTTRAFVEYYHKHPGYNNYPAVGISYEQAVEYCKWRTYVTNLGAYLDEMKFKNPEKHFNDSFQIKFYYRLPTLPEWEMISAGTLNVNDFPYGAKEINPVWKRKKIKAFNCIYTDEKKLGDSLRKRIYYTAEINSFYPNTSGCYNMIGNVAEMVLEKGIAKGGSYIHSLDSCKISSNQYYSQPERWLGFRCVAVKVK